MQKYRFRFSWQLAVLAVLILVQILTASLTLRTTERGQTTPNVNVLTPVTCDWQTDSEQTLVLPGIYPAAGGTITLRHELTEAEAAAGYVMLYNNHMDLRIELGGECLFELDTHGSRLSHIDSYCIAKLPQDTAGQQLTLTFTNCPAQTELPSVYIGTASEIVHIIFVQDTSAIIMLLAFAFISMAMLALLTVAAIRRAINRKQLWFMALLCCIELWSLTETNLMALLPIPMSLRCFVSYTHLAFLIIPIGFYTYNACGEQRPRIAWFIGILGIVNVIAEDILYLCGICNLYDTLVLTQTLLCVSLVVSCWCQLRYLLAKRPPYLALQAFCASEPLLLTAVSLVAYWLGHDDLYRYCFQMGVLVYLLLLLSMLIAELISRAFREQKQLDKLQTYAEWSVSDILTGLGNRRAFEICTEKVVQKKLNDAILIFLDVNGLKRANDTRGHEAGDKLLQKTAKCISNAYGSIGTCYRIGGDEMAVVIENPRLTDDELEDLLKQQIAQANAEGGEEVSLAFGISHLYSAEHIPCSLSLWKSNADKEMYADKMRAHLLRDTEESLRGESIDEITGILNSSGFIRMATRIILENPDQQYAIWYVDVKKFKYFNDFFGLEMGDRLIKYWANVIVSIMQPDEVCGRWIGDTIVGITHYADESSARKQFDFVTEKIGHFMNEYTIELSAGIYVLHPDDMKKPDLDRMLNCANIAHMHLKHQNGNTLTIFDEEMRLRQVREVNINQLLDSAIRGRQLKVYLQPQVDYLTGRIVGAEALCRWPESPLGPLSPGEFIPALEHTGQIAKLDRYMWEEVCRIIARWREDPSLGELPVSINISRIDVLNSNIITELTQLVTKYALSPSMLRLELTESAYISHPESLISVVNLLHEAGFTVEMDDFGSGFSSLNMLSEIHVDILKMDMRFLHRTLDKEQETRSRRIITAVAHMAEDLKLPIIVEGVETLDQAEFLKSIRCTNIQGYFFARPLPVELFEAQLRKSNAQGL